MFWAIAQLKMPSKKTDTYGLPAMNGQRGERGLVEYTKGLCGPNYCWGGYCT